MPQLTFCIPRTSTQMIPSVPLLVPMHFCTTQTWLSHSVSIVVKICTAGMAVAFFIGSWPMNLKSHTCHTATAVQCAFPLLVSWPQHLITASSWPLSQPPQHTIILKESKAPLQRLWLPICCSGITLIKSISATVYLNGITRTGICCPMIPSSAIMILMKPVSAQSLQQ